VGNLFERLATMVPPSAEKTQENLFERLATMVPPPAEKRRLYRIRSSNQPNACLIGSKSGQRTRSAQEMSDNTDPAHSEAQKT